MKSWLIQNSSIVLSEKALEVHNGLAATSSAPACRFSSEDEVLSFWESLQNYGYQHQRYFNTLGVFYLGWLMFYNWLSLWSKCQNPSLSHTQSWGLLLVPIPELLNIYCRNWSLPPTPNLGTGTSLEHLCDGFPDSACRPEPGEIVRSRICHLCNLALPDTSYSKSADAGLVTWAVSKGFIVSYQIEFSATESLLSLWEAWLSPGAWKDPIPGSGISPWALPHCS
jgi:hypothetical protein